MPSDRDSLRVVLAGTTFEDWYSADLDSDLFTEADAFHVQARGVSASLAGAFREGLHLDLYVGDDRQMAGVLDEAQFDVQRRRSLLELQGRDRAAYLVDCDAPALRGRHLTVRDLARKLLQPEWGIRNVVVSNTANRKLLMGRRDRGSSAGTSAKGGGFFDAPKASHQSDPNERPATILTERCRQLGLAWWMTAGGDLFIGKPNYDQAPSYHFYAFPPGHPRRRESNVETVRVRRAMGDRASEIVVEWQGSASSAERGVEPASPRASRGHVSVVDPDLVARGIRRRVVVNDLDALGRADAQRRGDYEMGRRRLGALTINVTVAGWRQGDRLFAVDTMAEVQVPEARIAGTYYVVQRRFREDRRQRRTELRLHEPRVWLA